jgi:hypothetical protein
MAGSGVNGRSRHRIETAYVGRGMPIANAASWDIAGIQDAIAERQHPPEADVAEWFKRRLA